MSDARPDGDAAEREAAWPAAVRDLVAGAILLLVGVRTGGSWLLTAVASGDWMPENAEIDLVFELLGAGWVLFGLFRLTRGLWRRAPRSPA